MGADHDLVQELRRDLREHLERFYAHLKLAPPYHHVEQALVELTAQVKGMTDEGRQELLRDHTRRWTLYRNAFLASGLPQKHRGIILGLIRSGTTGDLPPEYEAFLTTYQQS